MMKIFTLLKRLLTSFRNLSDSCDQLQPATCNQQPVCCTTNNYSVSHIKNDPASASGSFSFYNNSEMKTAAIKKQLRPSAFTIDHSPLTFIKLSAMNFFTKTFKSKIIALAFTMAGLFFVNAALGQATVTTDRLDYPPGDTVIITGSGFTPGETVTLQVLHDPTGGDDSTSAAHQPFTIIADSLGNINSYWEVPLDEDELGATLKLTADGQTSLLHAETTFTDAGNA